MSAASYIPYTLLEDRLFAYVKECQYRTETKQSNHHKAQCRPALFYMIIDLGEEFQ